MRKRLALVLLALILSGCTVTTFVSSFSTGQSTSSSERHSLTCTIEGCTETHDSQTTECTTVNGVTRCETHDSH